MKLRIEFHNGEIFEVPAEVIAHHRTSYYAEADGFMEGSGAWNDEFGQSMRRDELEDWLKNNMNWEDLEKDAVLVGQKERSDYNEMLDEAEIKFI